MKVPKRVAISSINAQTQNILNVIKNYAPDDIRSLLPSGEITPQNIVQVGQVIQGYPSVANYFLSSLINRIALFFAQSATFHNRFAFLKKGYLEFGETVEEVFIELAKVRGLRPDLAPQREFARTLPKVQSQFHIINYHGQYPLTVQDKDLYQAFTSMDGVSDFIAKLIQSIYTAEEYDEYLLFKYMLIKNLSNGCIHTEPIKTDDMDEAAIAFRAIAGDMTFMEVKDYNAAHVQNPTPPERQVIFMDNKFYARFGVKVLAAAFNMSEATFSQQLVLVNDWTVFDNDRFAQLIEDTGELEEVTDEELAAMKNVRAFVGDTDWFQVYDNRINFREVSVASGDYWNYFLNVVKTVSWSKFSNMVAFRETDVEQEAASITATVEQVIKSDNTVITLSKEYGATAGRAAVNIPVGLVHYIQTAAAAKDNVAVHPYGAFIIPDGKTAKPALTYNGKTYVSNTVLSAATTAGAAIVFSPGVPEQTSDCVPGADNQ